MIPISEIRFIFNEIFANMPRSKKSFEIYFPFHNEKLVPKLGHITRWHIRRIIAKNEFIIYQGEIPDMVIKILKYERDV